MKNLKYYSVVCIVLLLGIPVYSAPIQGQNKSKISKVVRPYKHSKLPVRERLANQVTVNNFRKNQKNKLPPLSIPSASYTYTSLEGETMSPEFKKFIDKVYKEKKKFASKPPPDFLSSTGENMQLDIDSFARLYDN